MSGDSARRNFRVLTRMRGGYNGTMFDVQLQSVASGGLLWAQTFTDRKEAQRFERALEYDLDELDDLSFRRKYSVPSDA